MCKYHLFMQRMKAVITLMQHPCKDEFVMPGTFFHVAYQMKTSPMKWMKSCGCLIFLCFQHIATDFFFIIYDCPNWFSKSCVHSKILLPSVGYVLFGIYLVLKL